MDILSHHASDSNPMKQCTGPCGRTFPATSEYFHTAKDRKSGFEAQCKECKRDRQRNHLSKPEARTRRREYFHRPEIIEREHKRVENSHKDPEVRRRYLNYQHEYNERPERKAKSHEYSQRPEVRMHRIEYLKVYRNLPHAKARRSSPENRLQWRVYSHIRRARKKSIKGSYTVEQIQQQLKRQKRKCYYCQKFFKKSNGRYTYHIDHTFPLSRVEGTDIPANDISYLVLACPHCNDSKGGKFPWEWPEGNRLL